MLRIVRSRPVILAIAILVALPLTGGSQAQYGLETLHKILRAGTAAIETSQAPEPAAPSGGVPASAEPASAPASPVPEQGVQAVQLRLNALGLDAGPADGVMGNRTRQAIGQYQMSLGHPATGVLDQGEFTTLIGGGPAPVGPTAMPARQAAAVAPAAAASQFQLLRGYDLPQNDYRSGMQENALRGIGLDACQSACNGDQRCAAFTFNERARICFLKSAAAVPAPFSRATSGIKLGMAVTADGPMLSAPGNMIADPAPIFAAPSQMAAEPSLVPPQQNMLASTPGGMMAAPMGSPVAQPRPLAGATLTAVPAAAAVQALGAQTLSFHSEDQGPPPEERKLKIRLAALLLLRVSPQLLDQRPLAFVGLLPDAAMATYLDQYGHDFAGRDEFEKADSRARFLSDNRDRFLAMVPKGEIRIAYDQYVHLGQYQDGAFQLSRLSWNDGGFPDVAGLEIAAPLSYPEKWAVGEAIARQVRDIERQVKGQLRVRTEYVIRDVFHRDQGAALDAAVVRTMIFAAGDTVRPIAELPLPEGAIVYGADPKFATTAPEADPELFRLFALRAEPALFSNADFLRDSFAMRQAIETNLMTRADSRLRTSWPSFFHASMLTTDAPSDREMDYYVQRVRERVETLGDVFQRTINCPVVPAGSSGLPCENRQGPDGNRLSFNLGQAFWSNGEWGFADRISSSGQVDTSPLVKPEDLDGSVEYPAGHNFPVLLLFLKDRNWEQRVVEDAPSGVDRITVQFGVERVLYHADPPYFLLAVRPKAVELEASSGPRQLALLKTRSGTELSDDDRLPFEHDILGLSLGMARDAAEKTLAEHAQSLLNAETFHAAPDDATALYAYVASKWSADNPNPVNLEPIYPTGGPNPRFVQKEAVERLLVDGTMVQQLAGGSGNLGDQTTVFYDSAGNTVVAISRYQHLERNLDQVALRQQIIAKYGQPVFEAKGELVWVDHQEIADAIRKQGLSADICGFTFTSTEGYFDVLPWHRAGAEKPVLPGIVYQPKLADTRKSCGRVLMVELRAEEIELHLADTGWAAAAMGKLLAADATAQADAQKKVTGDVKF